MIQYSGQSLGICRGETIVPRHVRIIRVVVVITVRLLRCSRRGSPVPVQVFSRSTSTRNVVGF